MAISDIKEFAHLTEADVEAIGRELDAIRRDIEDGRGERDAGYIRGTIRFQRMLELVGRAALVGSKRRPLWWFGAVALGVAKIVENMEIGHNVMHGQWDWMNDPEIHSSTWEWDMVGVSAHWQHTHNHLHHKYTNILGLDDDIGYGTIRVTRDEPWNPGHLANLFWNTLLTVFFEWGVGLQSVSLSDKKIAEIEDVAQREQAKKRRRESIGKIRRQLTKDYVLFPALTGKAFRKTLTANALANVIRNIWSNAVIFCGHFPDGAEKFTQTDVENETQGQWYLRQMLGSANFDAGRVLGFLSGHLSHQIEHHIFPDLPSNHYHEIAAKVRALCEKYDLPYTTGSFAKQYFLTWRTIAKLSLPDRFLKATSDNAPETSSELRFRVAGEPAKPQIDPVTGVRQGLKSAYESTKRKARRAAARARRAASAVEHRFA
ncbi:MAG: fatty acid desaturase family protein [Segniliparus sp.]|uniref:fatty acid desaturase family protein n=1 Tax=Segniliparus sp. TaxID=2804064 RepID=UPI003F372CD6